MLNVPYLFSRLTTQLNVLITDFLFIVWDMPNKSISYVIGGPIQQIQWPLGALFRTKSHHIASKPAEERSRQRCSYRTHSVSF